MSKMRLLTDLSSEDAKLLGGWCPDCGRVKQEEDTMSDEEKSISDEQKAEIRARMRRQFRELSRSEMGMVMYALEAFNQFLAQLHIEVGNYAIMRAMAYELYLSASTGGLSIDETKALIDVADEASRWDGKYPDEVADEEPRK